MLNGLLIMLRQATSLIPRPEEEEKGPGFSRLFAHHGGIPLLPHTIDILSYTCDANSDTVLSHCPQIYYSSIWRVNAAYH